MVLTNHNSFEEGLILSYGRLGKLIETESYCEKICIYMILQKSTPPTHMLNGYIIITKRS